jgi:trehalose 6-phosphate phosphatase
MPDVQRRLAGIPLRAVIGNHGLEPWRATDELRRTVEIWKAILEPAVAALPGVEIEDKTYSLALHYRRSRRKKEARQGLVRALGALGEVRVIGGKLVVNVLPLGAPHKGVALQRERDRLGCDTAFFLGDDETDEDVFAMEPGWPLLTIRVGGRRATKARLQLRAQRQIDDLLELLASYRRP